MILETKKCKNETIKIYDFKCEIACKIINDTIGIPKCLYKKYLYFLNQNYKKIYSININNFKIKNYDIDLEYASYKEYSLIFISYDKIIVLYDGKDIIEYKLNEKGQFFENKTSSEKNSKRYNTLIKGKNKDVILYGEKILFFSEKELLND